MKKLLWIGLACLVVFFGCSLLGRDLYRSTDDYFGDPTKGAVGVVVNGGSIATKTITPNMDVGWYALHFTNSVLIPPENFTRTISAGSGTTMYTEFDMEPDTNWFVTVTAINTDTPDPLDQLTWIVIGANGGIVDTPLSFDIKAGIKKTLPVPVIPITGGTGNLRVYVSWPDAAGENETLTGTLDTTTIIINADVGTPFDGPDVDPDLDMREVLYGPTSRGIGYYTLRLQLWDGGSLLWGYMEAVRIVDSLLTNTYDPVLDKEKFALVWTTGSVALPITPKMNNPVEILLDTDLVAPGIQAPPATLYQGESITVNAVCDPADPLLLPPADGAYKYQWYRDGATISLQTSASITITEAPADEAIHNYSILVTVLADPGATPPVPETRSSANFEMEISSSPAP